MLFKLVTVILALNWALAVAVPSAQEVLPCDFEKATGSTSSYEYCKYQALAPFHRRGSIEYSSTVKSAIFETKETITLIVSWTFDVEVDASVVIALEDVTTGQSNQLYSRKYKGNNANFDYWHFTQLQVTTTGPSVLVIRAEPYLSLKKIQIKGMA
ncbi:hypothetical protein HDE_09521 [Halotydeus destructor]|nr:hypothetical protein HDE_09521 [Halotydeus destructor]